MRAAGEIFRAESIIEKRRQGLLEMFSIILAKKLRFSCFHNVLVSVQAVTQHQERRLQPIFFPLTFFDFLHCCLVEWVASFIHGSDCIFSLIVLNRAISARIVLNLSLKFITICSLALPRERPNTFLKAIENCSIAVGLKTQQQHFGMVDLKWQWDKSMSNMRGQWSEKTVTHFQVRDW